MSAIGMSGEEEEMTVSSYSVAELWQRLPLHLAKDIISYFSFQDVGQLFSVLPVWKSLLPNLAVFNHGILFLDNCHVEYAKRFLPLLTKGTIKHLVLQGPLGYVKNLRKELIDYCTMTAAATLTFWKAKWYLLRWLRVMGVPERRWQSSLFSQTKIARIGFVNCTFVVAVACFPHWILREGEEVEEEKEWSFSIHHSFKTFSRENRAELQREAKRRTCHLDINEFEGAEHRYHDYSWIVEAKLYPHYFLEWCLDSKDIARAVLWPYPDATKQLQWLKTSLDALDEGTRQRMSRTYNYYDNNRRKYVVYVQKGEAITPNDNFRARNLRVVRAAKEDWQMEMDIYWDGEKLDLLDCAFLAAVLSIIPGVAEPPYKIDSHINPARVDRRLSDTWSTHNDQIDEEQSDREERQTEFCPFGYLGYQA